MLIGQIEYNFLIVLLSVLGVCLLIIVLALLRFSNNGFESIALLLHFSISLQLAGLSLLWGQGRTFSLLFSVGLLVLAPVLDFIIAHSCLDFLLFL